MATKKTIIFPATLRLTLPAGGACPGGPVLGLAFGQYKLNQMAFCKDFNARTHKYKPDAPRAVTLTAYNASTFVFVVKSPAVSWFLKNAAGIDSGSSRPGHVVVSTITFKHVYEIAKIKKLEDSSLKHLPLESICKSLVGTARSMGIQVVKELD